MPRLANLPSSTQIKMQAERTVKAFMVAKPIVGQVQESNFKIADVPLRPLEKKKVHIKILHASVDPYLYVLPSRFRAILLIF